MVSIAVREVSLSGVPVVKAFVNREMNIEDAVSVRSRSPFEDVLIGRGDGPGHARGEPPHAWSSTIRDEVWRRPACRCSTSVGAHLWLDV